MCRSLPVAVGVAQPVSTGPGESGGGTSSTAVRAEAAAVQDIFGTFEGSEDESSASEQDGGAEATTSCERNGASAETQQQDAGVNGTVASD